MGGNVVYLPRDEMLLNIPPPGDTSLEDENLALSTSRVTPARS
jgi:hypothetical protein